LESYTCFQTHLYNFVDAVGGIFTKRIVGLFSGKKFDVATLNLISLNSRKNKKYIYKYFNKETNINTFYDGNR